MPCTYHKLSHTSGGNHTHKSEFHNRSLDHNTLPEDLKATEYDQIGLVHTICVKVCSYSLI